MSVLRSPFATATLTTAIDGKPVADTFTCGENLVSVEVQAGEGNRSNSCTIVVPDPELAIAAKYRERSLTAGGIVVPVNLLESPDQSAETATAPNLASLVDGTKGDELARAIVAYCLANGVTDDAHIAAVLGTAQIESSMGQFLEEIDDGSNYAYLGADAQWHGRGLIQVTLRANYEKVGRLLGYDFIADPDALTKLTFAIPALVLGMRDGWYTSYKLADFGVGATYDYVRSRLIVNPGEGGQRRSNYVAYCQQWLARLPSLKPIASTTPTQVQTSTARSGLGAIANIAQNTVDVTATPTQVIRQNSTDDRATEIVVTLGWNDSDDRVSFSFWLTGVATSTNLPPRTTLTGKGIRFLVSREKKRSVLTNISLRQLAQRIGDAYGVNVDIPINAASEQVRSKLVQSGESDYSFLTRVAAAQGYLVQGDERSKTLKLIPAADKSVLVVKCDRSWGATLETRDEADADRLLGSLPDISSLADGEAIGEGYSTSLILPYPTMEQLSLQPGMLLDVGTDVVLQPFARTYRIKSVRWKWDGKLSGTVELYIPVNVKGKSKSKSADDTDTGAIAPKATVDPKLWQKGGTQYQIPGVGLVSASAEIIAGADATWADFTKNGTRIPRDPAIAKRCLELCQKIATVVKPALGGRTLRITSMYRDPSANSAAGGASQSRHLMGDAIDFYTDDQTPAQIMAILDPLWTFGGMSDYEGGLGIVHLDTRGTRVRW